MEIPFVLSGFRLQRCQHPCDTIYIIGGPSGLCLFVEETVDEFLAAAQRIDKVLLLEQRAAAQGNLLGFVLQESRTNKNTLLPRQTHDADELFHFHKACFRERRDEARRSSLLHYNFGARRW